MPAAPSAAPSPDYPDRVGIGMSWWRREVPDIDCSGKAVIGRILHLHEIILREVNRTLARHGLKYPAYAVMATLRVQGPPYAMSPKGLLGTLILTSGGLSNLLRRMERDGHITRAGDAHDGRSVVVRLTEQGRRVVEPAMRDHAETERRLVGDLPADQRDLLVGALARMMAATARP